MAWPLTHNPGPIDAGGEHAPAPRLAPAMPASVPRRWSGRDIRVASIIALIIIVSLADLYLTLMYLKNGGMAEGNPIARWVMASGCAWVLSLWKVVLVGFTCGVLWRFRARNSAELAAWICCLMMGWLTFQWSSYTDRVAEVVTEQPEVTQAATWVAFTD